MTKQEPLTKEERNAIATLRRLSKRWPKTLWLYAAAGDLEVMKKQPDGDRGLDGDGYDRENIVETIHIECDGGDW